MDKQVIISMDEFKEMEEKCSELVRVTHYAAEMDQAFELILNCFETEEQKCALIDYIFKNVDSFETPVGQLIQEKLGDLK